MAVPGEIAGLWTEYTNYGSGKVSWYSLWKPSIKLLENGMPVSDALAEAIEGKKDYILDPNSFLK